MFLDEDTLEARRLFTPVSIMEHHQMFNPRLSQYDICERLGKLWKKMQEECKGKLFTLDADNILALNSRVALALNDEPGEFHDREGWLNVLKVVNELGSLEDDDGHVYNWIFSELYWQHLTRYRFATAWMLVNALNLQRGHALNCLSLPNLGSFLAALSGSGPPISDGQTFFAQQFS
jgi:hypothetical protein